MTVSGAEVPSGVDAGAGPAALPHHTSDHTQHRFSPGLILTAIGIVFGDIGTSPLYAIKVALGAVEKPNPMIVLGTLSLALWSITLIVSVKYVSFVMRADNKGEGGIMALASLLWSSDRRGKGASARVVTRNRRRYQVARPVVTALGLFGSALLFGDGIITPAVSVLSAMEGLEVVAPSMTHAVLPLTVLILVVLFLIQRGGTDRIGKVFGPVMLTWFLAIGALGIYGIIQHPFVLAAVHPGHALDLLKLDPMTAAAITGGVFLTVTGGEALYADMGHIGRKPIQFAWFGIAMPALLLNYFGQGAAVIADPSKVSNPFFSLAPSWAVLPLVLLATAATVTASQAVITGVFSLARQAMQLGKAPRLRIVQTSDRAYGQVYVPFINWVLMVSTIALAIAFKSSDDLAAAYGVAVSGTMVITALLLFLAMRERMRWPLVLALPIAAVFITIDGFFLGINLMKVHEGGWLPLMIGIAVFTIMAIWARGTAAVSRCLADLTQPLAEFLASFGKNGEQRIPGTVILMTKTRGGVPPVLRHLVHHTRVLHETVIVMTVMMLEVPRVSGRDRLAVEPLGDGFLRVEVRYGFMQAPDIPVIMKRLGALDLIDEDKEITFLLSHETIHRARKNPQLTRFGTGAYAFLLRNAARVSEFFKLPQSQVVEVGLHLEI